MLGAGNWVGIVVSVLAGEAVGVIFLLFEKTSHKRHVMKWDTHRRRGRLYFVVIHYVLIRGMLLAILCAFIPFFVFKVGANIGLMGALLVTLLVLGTFAYVGTIEWQRCQEDFSVILMNKEVENMRTGFNGGREIGAWRV